MRLLRLTWMKMKAILGGILPLFAALLLICLLTLTVRETLHARSAEAISLAVIDADESAYSQRLIDALASGGALRLRVTHERDARRLLLRGTIEGVLTIPAGYGESLQGGDALLLRYQSAPFSASSDAAREIIAAETVMQQSYERAKAEAVSRGLVQDGDFVAFDALFAENRRKTANLAVFRTTGAGTAGGALFGSAAKRYAGSAGLLVMLLILSLSQFLSLPESRLVNTRLRSVPHGRALAFFSDNLALLLLSVLLAGASVPFAIGNLRAFAAAVLLYAFAVTGLASLLASGAARPGGTDALAPFLVLITSLLGGCFFDAALVSPQLARMARFLPQGMLIAAASGNAADGAMLLALGAVCFALSYLSGRKREA